MKLVHLNNYSFSGAFQKQMASEDARHEIMKETDWTIVRFTQLPCNER